MNQQTQKLWNSTLERNEHFQKALELMTDIQVKHIQEIFETIQNLKEQKEDIQRFIDIAIDEYDYEGELMYQSRFDNVESEQEYQVRCLNEYINQALKQAK